jgi:serine/threonine protein kinase
MQQSIEVLHTYTLEETLYTRGIATGYRARDVQLGDDVVLEAVPTIDDTPERRDFLIQYRSIAVKVMRLRHPNVVAIRDFVVHRDQFFVVKQYDSGLTLDALLFHSPRIELKLQIRESLCKDILRGLAALHQSNIIHRDVKAYGVYVKDLPEHLAQIDYFHLAVSAETEFLDSTICGTPVYMAPEIINPPHLFTKQSDVYAAGLLLLELLAGRSVQELMRLDGFGAGYPAGFWSYVKTRGGHVSERQIRKSVPPQYADLLACATKSNPSERFVDCEAFYESFALNAPLRVSAKEDPFGPESLTTYLERLPDEEERRGLVAAQRIATIDPRMAVAKCRQLVEAIAKRVYSRSLGTPANKSLANMVRELSESQVIPSNVFTHYYNVRKHGNQALHGDHDEDAALRPEVVRTVIGAAVRIATWYRLEYENRT